MRAYRQRIERRSAAGVDVTPFLSLMVILVPFLLISAVFSRITVLELEGVSEQAEEVWVGDPLQLRLIVRESIIEVEHRGRSEALQISRHQADGGQEALSRLLAELKRQHPGSSQVTILLEPQITYQELVQVMDTARVKLHRDGGRLVSTELFPSIALAETQAGAGAERPAR